MESALLLVVILIGGLIVLPIVALARASGLQREVEYLKTQVRDLRNKVETHLRDVEPSAVQEVRMGAQETPPVEELRPMISHAVSEPQNEEIRVEHVEIPAEPIIPEERTVTPIVEPVFDQETEPSEAHDGLAAYEIPAEVTPIESAPEEAFEETFAPRQTAQPAGAGRQWEAIIGGNWLNHIGAVATLMGVGYLLKYAFDNHWITQWMLVCAGVILGIALLVAGASFYQKRAEVFAQGLIGAGISILYLSVYAAYNLYHLIDNTMLALLLMSVVTATAIIQSLKYDSLAVSLIGLLGGFLTPLLLSSNGSGGGGSNGFGLFAYVTLLDIGLLVIALKKNSWAIIDPLALVGTYVTYVFWHTKYYSQDQILIAVGFLTIVWALFYTLDVYRSIGPAQRLQTFRGILTAVNTFAYYLAIYLIVNPQHHQWMGLLTLVIGGIYAVTAMILKDRVRENPHFLPMFVLTSITLLALASIIQFRDYTIAITLAIESAVLVWCAIRWRAQYVRAAAITLFSVAIVRLFITQGVFGFLPVRDFVLILNQRFLAFGVMALAFGMSAVLFGRVDDEDSDILCSTFHYVWVLLLFTCFTVEINDYFQRLNAVHHGGSVGVNYLNARIMIMAAVWTFYSLPLVVAGFRRHIKPLIYSGLAIIALGFAFVAYVGMSFEPIRNFIPFANLRAMSMIIVIVGILVQQRFMLRHREEHQWVESAVSLLQVSIAALGLELLTIETYDYFRKVSLTQATWISGISIELARTLVWAWLWTAYSLLLVWFGQRRNALSLLYSGFSVALLVFGCIIVGAFEYAPIKGFMPLMNLRTLTFVFVIAGFLLHQRWVERGKDEYTSTYGDSVLFLVGSALLGFEIISVETLDYFRMIAITHKIWVGGIDINLACELLLGIVWTVYSLLLVWYGLSKRVSILLYLGLIATGLGVWAVANGGYGFGPVAHFTLLINFRALAFVAVLAGLLAQQRQMTARKEEYPWVKGIMPWFQLVIVGLGFELLTAETNDYFVRLMSDATTRFAGTFPHEAKWLILATVWTLYALCLAWFGHRKSSPVLLYSGLGIAALGLSSVIFAGHEFEPVRNFVAAVNIRALTFAVVIAGLIIQQKWLECRRNEYDWMRAGSYIFYILISLTIFELLTVEVWDFVGRLIELDRPARFLGSLIPASLLNNLRQAMLSMVWVIYSILLMSYGFARRIKMLRFIAIGLFYITIFKVFIFDLAHLETLYRIFSFITLGLILLATSYLYQRFMPIIMDVHSDASEDTPSIP